jgi:hypothetical protein
MLAEPLGVFQQLSFMRVAEQPRRILIPGCRGRFGIEAPAKLRSANPMFSRNFQGKQITRRPQVSRHRVH